MSNVGCVRCVTAMIKGQEGADAEKAVLAYLSLPASMVLIYGGKSYCLKHYVEKTNGVKPWKVETTEEKLGISEPVPWTCNYFSPVGMGKCSKPVPHHRRGRR